MPRRQTRKPLTREKRTAFVGIACKPSERDLWFSHFSDGNLSRTVRDFLNRTCKRKGPV